MNHHHVHAILLRYLPGTLAETSLDHALADCGLSRQSFQLHHLPDVIAKLESSIRLFVDGPDQGKLRSELGALGGLSQRRALSLDIVEEADVSRARLLMKRVCNDFGISSVATQKCVTIVSELTRNIVSYTSGGSMELEVTASPRRICIRAKDTGGGIKNLDQILAGAYQSRTGLGKGILGVKRLSDDFQIKSGPSGTDIRAELGW
ncbi:MAG: ATP-binding protein [Polyangiaceae bacterium]|nr:ATP-binding protein [Polyangiaceae bacterium]